MSKVKVPYDEMDANVVELCRALNEFTAVRTVGSCGGHEDPKPGQAPAGEWLVAFEIKKTAAGWIDLEFLAWVINHDYGQSAAVELFPDSPPPYLNSPGQCLHFVVTGRDGADPEDLATFLRQMRQEYHQGR